MQQRLVACAGETPFHLRKPIAWVGLRSDPEYEPVDGIGQPRLSQNRFHFIRQVRVHAMVGRPTFHFGPEKDISLKEVSVSLIL